MRKGKLSVRTTQKSKTRKFGERKTQRGDQKLQFKGQTTQLKKENYSQKTTPKTKDLATRTRNASKVRCYGRLSTLLAPQMALAVLPLHKPC